jgi:tRNA (guanine37-N1)-methyltransferase
MVQPLRDTIQAAKIRLPDAKVIYLSPQGKRLDQQGVVTIAAYRDIILIAGRYEGLDERLIDMYVDEEWSIGDYVLSGGELPAMVLIDAMARTIPGVLGHDDSADEDSFANGLLDCPHYTRPELVDGVAVPQVLLSGDHEQIRRWRLKQALGRTWHRRPDLLEAIELNEEQKMLLTEFKHEKQ